MSETNTDETINESGRTSKGAGSQRETSSSDGSGERTVKTITYQASRIQRWIWNCDNLKPNRKSAVISAALAENGGSTEYAEWYEEDIGAYYLLHGKAYSGVSVRHLGNGRFAVKFSNRVPRHDENV